MTYLNHRLIASVLVFRRKAAPTRSEVMHQMSEMVDHALQLIPMNVGEHSNPGGDSDSHGEPRSTRPVDALVEVRNQGSWA